MPLPAPAVITKSVPTYCPMSPLGANSLFWVPWELVGYRNALALVGVGDRNNSQLRAGVYLALLPPVWWVSSHFTGKRFMWCWGMCLKLPREASSSAWHWIWVLHPKPSFLWSQNTMCTLLEWSDSPWALMRQLSLFPLFLHTKKVVKS